MVAGKHLQFNALYRRLPPFTHAGNARCDAARMADDAAPGQMHQVDRAQF